jgi:Tfp pilus assembly protein PilO
MNEKQVTIITIACLALILLGGAGAFYYFDMMVLEEKNQELARVKEEVSAADAKVKKIPDLKSEITQLKADEARLITRIPNLVRAEYDTLANLLDDLRRRSGVIVPRASWVIPQKPQPIAGRPMAAVPVSVHKVQYDLQVSGGFYQLLRYINLLEAQERYIGIDTMTLVRGNESESGGRTGPQVHDLKISVYTYTYRKDDLTPVIETQDVEPGRSTELPD